MIAWSTFAVGGVYVWASAPLIVAAVALGATARPRPGVSRETRLLDGALLVGLALVAVQLVPLPEAVRSAVSPNADPVREALQLVPVAAAWRPLSVSAGATAYSMALIGTAFVVFWAARQACGRGATRSLVKAVAFIGLAAALVAILMRSDDPRLLYGLWSPQAEGARPFGPFVNRNHYAAWVVMAFPLTAGYVAAAAGAHRPSRRLASELAALLRGLGSSALWAGVAGAVMILSLLTSASRSGLMAFGASLACGVLIGRRRLTRRARFIGFVGFAMLTVFLVAYADFQPLLLRVDETLTVGAGDRPAIWRETMSIVEDFWLAGAGLGGFQSVMLVYQQADRTFFFNQAHNQYLHLLAEGGLLLAIPALVAIAAFVRLFRARMRRDDSSSLWLRVGGAAALIAIAVQGIWETGLRMPANGLLFALAAAIAVHRPAEDGGLSELDE